MSKKNESKNNSNKTSEKNKKNSDDHVDANNHSEIDSHQIIEKLKSELEHYKQSNLNNEKELQRYKTEVHFLNQKLEKILVDLNQEFLLATKIQRKLTPTEYPKLTGLEFSTKFIPGMQNGGDYFDIFELEDKWRFGVVIASCTGYALSALMLSVLIRLASEIEAKRGMEPFLVIDKIAKEVAGQIRPQDRGSLFYGILDRRNFEFTYASAGSILALWQTKNFDNKPSRAVVSESKDSGRIITLESGCQNLSEIKNGDIASLQSKITLSSQDRLVFLTEGWALGAQQVAGSLDLMDSKSMTENLYNESKKLAIQTLQSAAKQDVHGVRQELLIKARSTSDESSVSRDQTILVMEVKERVIKLA